MNDIAVSAVYNSINIGTIRLVNFNGKKRVYAARYFSEAGDLLLHKECFSMEEAIAAGIPLGFLKANWKITYKTLF
jgi:hypothetical protein